MKTIKNLNQLLKKYDFIKVDDYKKCLYIYTKGLHQYCDKNNIDVGEFLWELSLYEFFRYKKEGVEIYFTHSEKSRYIYKKAKDIEIIDVNDTDGVINEIEKLCKSEALFFDFYKKDNYYIVEIEDKKIKAKKAKTILKNAIKYIENKCNILINIV